MPDGVPGVPDGVPGVPDVPDGVLNGVPGVLNGVPGVLNDRHGFSCYLQGLQVIAIGQACYGQRFPAMSFILVAMCKGPIRKKCMWLLCVRVSRLLIFCGSTLDAICKGFK